MPDPLSSNNGFGMKVAVYPALSRHALDDVFVEHQLVGHREQGVEPHVDLGLARGTDFVVLDLDLDPETVSMARIISERMSWKWSRGTGKYPSLYRGL